MSDFKETLKANIAFHSALAEGEHYEKQPFFSPENQQRVRQNLSAIAARAPGKKMLDVGCGTGFILRMATDIFEELVGIDITPAMLSRAPKHPKISLHLAAIENMPFESASFDVVTAYGVLHHVHSIAEVLQNVRRVLRPGGIFYADESPNYYCVTTLRNLELHQSLSSELQRQAIAVQTDAQRYLQTYGIASELVNQAMIQDKQKGGLRQEEIEKAAQQAGFSRVSIGYRWFLGQGSLPIGEQQVIHNYLTAQLPLSRSLFKYLQVELVA